MSLTPISLTLRKGLIGIFLLFFLLSSLLSLSYYISQYRAFRGTQTQEIGDHEFRSTLTQVNQFLTQPFLAAENMTQLLKGCHSLEDKKHILLINALGTLKTSLARSVVISLESGESFSAIKKISKSKSTSKEIFDVFWIQPKGDTKHIQKTVCDASGTILSVKKYPPIPKEVLDYLEDETKGFSLLDDFRGSDGYQAALRSKTPGWYSPMESDSGDGYFTPLIFPITDEDKKFLGTVTLFIPSTAFAELGAKLFAENPFTQICVFNKEGSLVLCSHQGMSIYKSNNQGQWSSKSAFEMGETLNAAYHEYQRKGSPDFLTVTTPEDESGGHDITYFQKLTPYTNWILSMVFNKSHLIQSAQKDIKTDLLFLILKFILFSGIIFWSLRLISRPMIFASSQLKSIADLTVTEQSVPTSLFSQIQNLLSSVAELTRNTQIFQKLVPKNLVQTLAQNNKEVSVGGVRSEITVSFCDTKSFHYLLKTAPAEYVFQYLSLYFEPFTKIALQCQGFVDKYMDSVLMALFGTPSPLKNHSEMACRAALACLDCAEHSLNPQLKAEERPPLDLIFGIATGYAISGLAGSSDRLQYSAFGDTVNLASRLKALNAYYGTRILVNESTYQQTAHLFFFRPVDLVRVHGKDKAILIYELMAPYDLPRDMREATPTTSWSIQQYMDFILTVHKGWEAYHKGQWKKSIEFYKKALTMKPQDKICLLFIQRAKELLMHPPGDAWDGVYNA